MDHELSIKQENYWFKHFLKAIVFFIASLIVLTLSLLFFCRPQYCRAQLSTCVRSWDSCGCKMAISSPAPCFFGFYSFILETFSF